MSTTETDMINRPDRNELQTGVDAPNELELVDQIDQMASLLASAAQSFCDISALFEAVQSAAPTGSLQSRLAQAGVNMSESLNCDFDRYSRDFGVRRISAALGLGEFRRFSSAEQSSSDTESA
jgi:hypothetical protein